MLKKSIVRGIELLRERISGVPAYVRKFERLAKASQPPVQPEFDLIYVLPPKDHHGWILDAICREIDRFADARTKFVSFLDPLPSSKAYFFSHYGYFRDTICRFPNVLHARNVLFYTHPRELWYSSDELTYTMNLADAIVSMCSLFAGHLIESGVREELVSVELVGADPDFFHPHDRGAGKIGLCSGYLPRKGGERILELIRLMPNHEFVLCGRNWERWERFDELRACANLEYLQIPYQEYPQFYDTIDVFVSLSELEGGPVPLIEAAMSNAVPVCSSTGHAGDIIRHGVNGYIFDVDAPLDEVRRLILQARDLDGNVRSTVEHLTWKRFSHRIQQLAGLRCADRDESATEDSQAA